MIVIGLTGGLASGKTTTAVMFKQLGATVLDADKIAHKALYRNTPAYKKVLKKFGKDIRNQDNSINRKKLGKVVFENKKKQRELCAIVHPWVFDYIERKLKDFRKNKAIKAVIIEAVLLIESGLYKRTDAVVLIKATEKLQIKRAILRKMTQTQAKQRMRFQLTFQEKARFANYIIDNCGALKYTREQVKKVWKSVLNLEKSLWIS